ncbi:MAG: glycosyltransferase family 2 protein [Microscillaceae bacterium]|nr:glycosyltransferase family 2 protein [Microscillaceae bacterium]
MKFEARTLSILIPVYNEEATIWQILGKIIQSPFPEGLEKEIILIDDASKDQSADLIRRFIAENLELNISCILHSRNQGKGVCIRDGIQQAKGEIILIQDADLEYDPRDYPELLAPILDGYADVVFGSRFVGSKAHRVLFFWHYLGNRFLTFLSNLCTNLNLTDMECGFKVFKSELIRPIRLREKGFGFEPEVTAKISRIPQIRIYEVGVAYYGRTYLEGKKVNWKDGIWAIYCILRYNWGR